MMLNVVELEEAKRILSEAFAAPQREDEKAELSCALGRILSEDIVSGEYVPDFDRSTVDGYALCARDVFGCSQTSAAMLRFCGKIAMGTAPETECGEGECIYVPTGGAMPRGADAVVMIEHTQRLGNDVVVYRPCAPGENIIFRGDDVKEKDVLFRAGKLLTAKDIGALAALGRDSVCVRRRPSVGIISTGDELISPSEKPKTGQIRDVNGPLLEALCAGARVKRFGIVRDDEGKLERVVAEAARQCDAVLISGATSVGEADAVPAVLARLGRVLFHGLALKPGKPALAAIVGQKPVFGLPGNPLAVYYVFDLLVRELLCEFGMSAPPVREVCAQITRAIPSNHGRAECVAVKLADNMAVPLDTKSGLITALAAADGYVLIPRSSEGVESGRTVSIRLFGGF